MKNANVPSQVAALLVATTLGVAGYLEWRAFNARDRRDHGPKTMTAQMCQSCHSDAKMLARMKEKQGAHNTAPVYLPLSPSACPRQPTH
jgi:nitrate/TMAO reductase-like tetraheme cytochrome c subunit